MLDWEIERKAKVEGFSAICGIDEAGRGPLAGPVCAAAVILPFGCEIDGLNDSKKLTEKKREALFEVVQERALAYSIALVDHKTIDEINILEATFLAMRQAAEGLQIPADYALVDGNRAGGRRISVRKAGRFWRPTVSMEREPNGLHLRCVPRKILSIAIS